MTRKGRGMKETESLSSPGLRVLNVRPSLQSGFRLAYLTQARDDLFDEPVGRGGAGRDADTLGTREVFRVNLVGRLDEITLGALLLADREQLEAVRGVLAADDVEDVNVAGERARRVLPVARRRADGVDACGSESAFALTASAASRKVLSFKVVCETTSGACSGGKEATSEASRTTCEWPGA